MASRGGAVRPDFQVKAVRRRKGKDVFERIGVGFKLQKNGLYARVLLNAVPIPSLNGDGELEIAILLAEYEERGAGR